MTDNRVVEATAPTRIDLAGGTLDIWPLYLFHPGSVTVNVAIDRRAWCRVETGVTGVRIESKDTLAKAEGRDLDEVLAGGSLALVAYILRALGIETGVKVVTQSRVPAGSGLGGSSALAVAVAAAASTRRRAAAGRRRPVAGRARRGGAGHRGAHGHPGLSGRHPRRRAGDRPHARPHRRRAQRRRPGARGGVPAAGGRGGDALLGHQQLGRVQGTDRRGRGGARSAGGDRRARPSA